MSGSAEAERLEREGCAKLRRSRELLAGSASTCFEPRQDRGRGRSRSRWCCRRCTGTRRRRRRARAARASSMLRRARSAQLGQVWRPTKIRWLICTRAPRLCADAQDLVDRGEVVRLGHGIAREGAAHPAVGLQVRGEELALARRPSVAKRASSSSRGEDPGRVAEAGARRRRSRPRARRARGAPSRRARRSSAAPGSSGPRDRGAHGAVADELRDVQRDAALLERVEELAHRVPAEVDRLVDDQPARVVGGAAIARR